MARIAENQTAAMASDRSTEVIGHQRQLAWFANAIQRGRFSGTFMLVGPPGIGKTALATLLTKSLFCERSPAQALSPCNRCEPCIQVQAGTHPDLIQVRKPDDRAYIPLDLLIGPPEARMQEGFCREVRLRPLRGSRKVAILHDADYLNEEGANSLLKTLEEPPSGAVILLIGTNEQRQLPTIRSRCRIIRMQPPAGEDARRLMAQRGIECTSQAADDAIELCGGDCVAAASLLAGDADQFRTTFAKQLTARPIPAIEVAKTVAAYVDDAGKDAPQRRDRLRDIFAIAAATFRQQLQHLLQHAPHQELGHAPENAFMVAPCIYRIERTIDAITQVQRNANQATLIESWSADIARGRAV